jgi:hypothetical protein
MAALARFHATKTRSEFNRARLPIAFQGWSCGEAGVHLFSPQPFGPAFNPITSEKDFV